MKNNVLGKRYSCIAAEIYRKLSEKQLFVSRRYFLYKLVWNLKQFSANAIHVINKTAIDWQFQGQKRNILEGMVW